MYNLDFNYLINRSTKEEFMNFLYNDNDGRILDLLLEDNIIILRNSPIREIRLRYIMSYSKYRDNLFCNEKMIDILFSCDISKLYATFSHLNMETLNKILTTSLNSNYNKDICIEIYKYLNEEQQIELLDLFKPYKEYYKYLINCSPKVINKLLNEYITSLNDIDIGQLFSDGKKSFLTSIKCRYSGDEIPDSIYINPSFFSRDIFNKMFNDNNIYTLRKILNDGIYCTDISKLNKYLKEKEDEIINSLKDSELIEPFNRLNYLFSKFTEPLDTNNKEEIKKRYDMKNEIYNILNKNNIDMEVSLFKKNNIYNTLKKYSDAMVSNYIIDYHFEENYYNVMLDIQELICMHSTGKLSLENDRVEIYKRIIDIDNLTIKEKYELHNQLKKYNMIEILYDDMSFARKIVGEEIKNSSLTKEKLQKYIDKELTDKYGVPVYKIGEEPFFALVKSGMHKIDDLPIGRSYSLIGNGSLATYNENETYLYDTSNLNPEQVVHVFPIDSFTSYKPYQYPGEIPSEFVNTLMMPDELVETFPNIYNEILILEQGKASMDIDNKIPFLKQIAKYCVDKITEQDIKEANINGIGIVLVDSSKCHISDKKENELYFHNIGAGYASNMNLKYLNSELDQQKYDSNRIK